MGSHLGRLCTYLLRNEPGTLHPLIHLGFGIEFQQPAIVAEALAQTYIHPTWLDSFLLETDKASKDTGYPSKALVTLLDEVREDKKLSTAARWTDRNLIFEGVLSRARTEMFNYCIQWKVKSDQIEAAEAEIANAAGAYRPTLLISWAKLMNI